MNIVYPNIQKTILTIIMVSIVFVSWCWSDFEWEIISFGSYNMKIWTMFEETTITKFENKRTKNHIVKSYIYKLPPESIDVFEKNIIIGVIENNQHIDTNTFSRLSIQKLQKTFQWYKQLWLYRRSFTCKSNDTSKKIEYYIHSYSFVKAINNKEIKTYYITQSQRSTNRFLYTVSASTDIEVDIAKYEIYMKTLQCQ